MNGEKADRFLTLLINKALTMNRILFILWNAHIIFESLPISSSGHIQLLNSFLAHLKKQKPLIMSSSTEHLMHIPTIGVLVAVLAYHGMQQLSTLSLNLLISLGIAAALADTVTGISYLVLKKSGMPRIPLWLGFLITSCALLSLAFVQTGTSQSITIMQALLIGAAQSCALLPGISRLGVTTVTSLWLGIDPLTSVLFSLILELGLITVALAKQFIDVFQAQQAKENAKNGAVLSLTPVQGALLMTCTVLSTILLELVIQSVLNNTFMLFGWYMLFLALSTKLSKLQ